MTSRVLLVILLFAAVACGGSSTSPTSGAPYSQTDLVVGTGTQAAAGNRVTVAYTGWLTDGHPFDSSRFAGRTPFTFQIGQQQVIPGWDEGIPGEKIGGKRCLTIPAALAYGAQGQQDQTTGAVIIPPNATLVFDITLISVQ